MHFEDSTLPPPAAGPVRVLLVESEPDSRNALAAELALEPGLQVIAAVPEPVEALAAMRRQRPDVVLMDQNAAGIGSVEGTRRIMQTLPLPVVLCVSVGGGDAVFRTMEAGAVAWVEKPAEARGPERTKQMRQLGKTLRLMSEVKVVRHWIRPEPASSPAAAPARATAAADAACPPRVVGIGASTGGPMVLKTILCGLPQPFAAPILVVQHMARGFLPGMVAWLQQSTGMTVQLAAHGMHPRAGQVYIAPDACQMGLGAQGSIQIDRHPSDALHQPSVAALFRSLAQSCGPRAIGVMLTGMGRDGAAELKLMNERGSITIAQDRETSTVHGMPGEAIALGGATYVLAADRIAGTLASLVQAGSKSDASAAP